MTTQAIKHLTLGLFEAKTPTRRTGTLRKGDFEVLNDLGGASLRCTSGTLWVTLENDSKDHILTQNQSLPIPNLGKVLVSGSGTYRI
jgi:hypothetical protein